MSGEQKGSLTVEAVILLPLLLGAFITVLYLGIYIYDKTLVIQDINSIASLIRDKRSFGEESVNTIVERAFKELKEEHPYIVLDNVSIKVKEKGKNTTITLKGDWEMPVYRMFKKSFAYEKKVKSIDPIATMYSVQFIETFLKRGKPDES